MTDAEVLQAAVRELRERPTGLPVSLNPLIADILNVWGRVGANYGDKALLLADAPEVLALARAITGDQP